MDVAPRSEAIDVAPRSEAIDVATRSDRFNRIGSVTGIADNRIGSVTGIADTFNRIGNVTKIADTFNRIGSVTGIASARKTSTNGTFNIVLCGSRVWRPIFFRSYQHAVVVVRRTDRRRSVRSGNVRPTSGMSQSTA